MLTAVCFSLLFLSWLVLSAEAVATPVTDPAPELLWGPYLTGTSTTGTVVNVKTDIPTTMTVEYATDTYYTSHLGYDQDATDGASTQLHHVPLAGLSPDTLYHYRVVYDGNATGDFHFRTFPENGPITFVMYSDTQDQLPTFSQLERHKLVAFVLNSGDLVNNAANISDWDRYFAAGRVMMANATVYPALGNHDANDTHYYQAYGVPEYYSFDCGAAHIAVLDSNDWAWPEFPTQSGLDRTSRRKNRLSSSRSTTRLTHRSGTISAAMRTSGTNGRMSSMITTFSRYSTDMFMPTNDFWSTIPRTSWPALAVGLRTIWRVPGPIIPRIAWNVSSPTSG